MYDFQVAKGVIEQIHISYLCDHFNLCDQSMYPDLQLNGMYPDLFGKECDDSDPKCMFEMKSRTFPHKQNPDKPHRKKNQFEWWEITEPQIREYERISSINELKLFWILLLGHTKKRLSEYKRLSEAIVLKREIYVAPWKAHELAPGTRSMKKHLSLSKVKEQYDFKRHGIEKGELWIAKDIADDVDGYFINI